MARKAEMQNNGDTEQRNEVEIERRMMRPERRQSGEPKFEAQRKTGVTRRQPAVMSTQGAK